MATIKIRSKRALFYPPFHSGIVEMSVESIENNVEREEYVLVIRDTCYVELEEEYMNNVGTSEAPYFERATRTVTKIVGEPTRRISRQGYANIKELINVLETSASFRELPLDDAIIEAFRRGLFHVTAQEIAGGVKWYGCESIDDWEIVWE